MNRKLQLAILLLLIGIPSCYYGFIATDMYVSTAKFAVRGSQTGGMDGLASMFGGTSMGSSSDSYIVAEYIQSEDMLNLADTKLGVREHYSTDTADLFSRLKPNATNEEALEYWNSVVRVSYDSMTSVLTVEVRAFSPTMAQQIARNILAASETLMNKMNDRVQADLRTLARREVGLAETRYAKARIALKDFREAHKELDPTTTASSHVGMVTSLEAEISKLTLELHTKQNYMDNNSIKIRVLKQNLVELNKQLAAERARLGKEGGDELLDALEVYEGLNLELEFARKYYTTSLSSLEAARVQSESKTVYLEAFQLPTLPDEAIYPERLLSVGLSIVVGCMGYALLLLTVAAVKEHIGI